MSREVRRVPIDFDWPMRMIWPGFCISTPDCQRGCEYPVQCAWCVTAESVAWPRIDPPSGPGWQVWESVSEGSPVTPVFGTADALAGYLSSRAGHVFLRGTTMSVEQALAFIRAGHSMGSMVVIPGRGLVDGSLAAAEYQLRADGALT